MNWGSARDKVVWYGVKVVSLAKEINRGGSGDGIDVLISGFDYRFDERRLLQVVQFWTEPSAALV